MSPHKSKVSQPDSFPIVFFSHLVHTQAQDGSKVHQQSSKTDVH